MRPQFKGVFAGRHGPRRVPGTMNKTEARYADYLEAQKLAGEIVDWQFEAMTFVLAKLCRLTPDFVVLHNDGSLELVDTKGWQSTDDALVKTKCAAEKFYWFRWSHVKERSKRDGGGWERREF